ncbi:BQ2448_6297 [Microbotryum intermedium]|uniref:BQ2448_6297 protein n=1 Tax=Microbotryum intermedium TaxID=269621 RepID=A0A238FKT7_9BASI|nr:BQ2448_6297 [Microbotryum intermedium]
MPSDDLGAITAQLAAVHTDASAQINHSASMNHTSAAPALASDPTQADPSEPAPQPPVHASPVMDSETATGHTDETSPRAHQDEPFHPPLEEPANSSEVVSEIPRSQSQPTQAAVPGTSPTWHEEPPRHTNDASSTSVNPTSHVTSPDTPSTTSVPSNSTQPPSVVPPPLAELARPHAGAAIETSAPGIETSSLPPVAAASTSHTAAPVATSQPHRAPKEQEEQWLLKTIIWPPLPPTPSQSFAKTLTARAPSLHCNVLLLRHSITLPSSLDRVSYSDLSSILADHLLTRSNTERFSASVTSALSTLPSTRYGLDLNPRFGSIDGFTPSPAVALFKAFDIPLLHGWCVDPDERSGETWNVVVENGEDYDSVVEKIVRGRELSGGQLEGEGRAQNDDEVVRVVERSSKWSAEEAKAVREAHILHSFLSSTSTQLTYHGLMLLSSSLSTSSLSTLFRNSHVSVLYRRPEAPTSQNSSAFPLPRLFTLVTDSAFVHEPEIVWESLEDVDGSASEFYDGHLRKSHVRGGDYVAAGGRSGKSSRTPRQTGSLAGDGDEKGRTVRINNDEDLARQLQYEEERWRIEDDERRGREMQRVEWEAEQQHQQQQQQQYSRSQGQSSSNAQASSTALPAGGRKEAKAKKSKRDKECLIM